MRVTARARGQDQLDQTLQGSGPSFQLYPAISQVIKEQRAWSPGRTEMTRETNLPTGSVRPCAQGMKQLLVGSGLPDRRELALNLQ